jgi:hypothetical protein
MSLAYGIEVKSHKDPFLTSASRALEVMEEVAVPGAFLSTLSRFVRVNEKVFFLLLNV